ncbi:MAG: hypothetical protein NTV70_17500 [Acidobacteria bacterium]|nr:hypothetical protein [Acidobacteriota bacterium]
MDQFAGLNPVEQAGADQHAGDDFARDGRGAQPLTDLAAELGQAENDQHLEREIGGAGAAGKQCDPGGQVRHRQPSA